MKEGGEGGVCAELQLRVQLRMRCGQQLDLVVGAGLAVMQCDVHGV